MEDVNKAIRCADLALATEIPIKKAPMATESPSAAGMAITEHACDGWVFWSVETAAEVTASEIQQTETQSEPTGETASTQAAEVGSATKISPQPAEPNNSNFFKIEWQRAVPKGQTRWHCNLCNKHFLAPSGETPESCPKGHKA